MSVWKRKWKDASGLEREAWVVDVQVEGKDRKVRRVRRVSRGPTRRAAEKLEHEIREELMNAGDVLPDPVHPLGRDSHGGTLLSGTPL